MIVRSWMEKIQIFKFLGVVASLILMATFVDLPILSRAIAQDVRQRPNILQQTEELRRKTLLEHQKNATAKLIKKNNKIVEANLIYKNLRNEQKVPHDEAVESLKKRGFPTDKISAPK